MDAACLQKFHIVKKTKSSEILERPLKSVPLQCSQCCLIKTVTKRKTHPHTFNTTQSITHQQSNPIQKHFLKILTNWYATDIWRYSSRMCRYSQSQFRSIVRSSVTAEVHKLLKRWAQHLGPVEKIQQALPWRGTFGFAKAERGLVNNW